MEEVQDSVGSEVATQTEVQDIQQAQNVEAENRNQRNWSAMREKQEVLERELRMQREMNEKLLHMATQSFPKQQEEQDEFDSLGDDEIIQKGRLKKYVEKEKSKIVKEAMQEVERHLAKREQSQYLVKLKSNYSDFDEVVNKETLALLEENEPELAQTISEISDPYKAYLQCYKFIKSSNLILKAPESRRTKEINKKIEKNENTVQSPQAYDKRPLAQAFKMTDEVKTQLYEEMMGYASQASFSF